DRAKCVLIEYLNMTEADAHRYIEKQAMDLRRSKRDLFRNKMRRKCFRRQLRTSSGMRRNAVPIRSNSRKCRAFPGNI
ncbi:MAG: ANTAR domain-containing protein, partial [Thermoguttaceae bacterium]|nr:ANTAR domain-containing protein [Thermoguttaceae bacterium]